MQKRLPGIIFVFILWLSPRHAYGQIVNVISSSFGAANRGAATAMPLDASNSQYWNPASITGLEETELDLNIQPYFPKTFLGSTLNANALAAGQPPANLSGGNSSGRQFGLFPSLGFVKKTEQSPWTSGLLITSTIGPGQEFSHNHNNPIISPQPPKGFGGGDFKEDGNLIYIAPTLAYKFGKHWSVGVQPDLIVTSLLLVPLNRVKPDDANGDGTPTYPIPKHQAWNVGMGIQGGIYCRYKDLHLGTSLKSPQWSLPYRFISKDEVGNLRRDNVRIYPPMILSIGLGYSGIPKVKLAADARFIDYTTAAGFSQSGFTKLGAFRGPGWNGIWAGIASAQYELTEKCVIRGVYAYNENPIRPRLTQFAIGAPAVIKHQMSIAFAYQLHPHLTLAVAYLHGFSNSVQGPFITQNGPVPGSSVRLKGSLDSVAITLIFK